MGREVRMVPPNWEHPVTERHNGAMGEQPMHDEHFDDVFAKWLEDFDRVRRGELDTFESECYPRGLADWLQDDGRPPDPAYYRPWKDSEATWFQLWQTVSEGTPVSPPFATRDELAQYLAENGDYWDQKRARNPEDCRLFGMTPGKPGWGIERATAFVNAGWAPSMMVMGGTVFNSKDIPAAMEKTKTP